MFSEAKGDSVQIAREYMDSLLVESRVVGAVKPDTAFRFLGENFSIHRRRDSLIASSYRDGQVLVFDPKTWAWKETWKDTSSSDIDPLHSLYLYEDDDWVIRGTDHGEFGSASWFIDKHSGAEYAFLTLSGKVHRTDSCFFFVKETRIIGIPDPSMGFLCDSTTCYEKAKDVGRTNRPKKHSR